MIREFHSKRCSSNCLKVPIFFTRPSIHSLKVAIFFNRKSIRFVISFKFSLCKFNIVINKYEEIKKMSLKFKQRSRNTKYCVSLAANQSKINVAIYSSLSLIKCCLNLKPNVIIFFTFPQRNFFFTFRYNPHF